MLARIPAGERATPTTAIPLECDKFEKNYDRALPTSFYPVKRALLRDVCAIADSSRGFLALLLLRHLFDSIDIVGFGGKGHHDEGAKWEDLHHLGVEHELLGSRELDPDPTPS